MTWQSGLPVVAAIAARPLLVTARKWCGWAAETTASRAILTLPSVPFLKPTGQDSPDASSRWIWLSVVRAPIRSEEHTSELQSLMRISYAVLCLKTKKERLTTAHVKAKQIM